MIDHIGIITYGIITLLLGIGLGLSVWYGHQRDKQRMQDEHEDSGV